MAKKILTKKQKIILLLIYTFRFLNSKQIQEFLKHKDHRRINSWLKDLTTKEYLERNFTPRFGLTTKPAVFNLSSQARAYIRDSFEYYFPTYLARLARDRKASKAVRMKCQIIAEWYLYHFSHLCIKMSPKHTKIVSKKKEKPQAKKNMVSKKEQDLHIRILNTVVSQLTTNIPPEEENIPINKFHFFTPACFPQLLLTEKIKPDVYIRNRTSDGIYHGFGFVIDAYTTQLFLKYTLKRIFNTLRSEDWKDDAIYSLHVYFLVPNNQVTIYINKVLPSFMNKYSGLTPLNIHITTRNQLYKERLTKTKNLQWKTISSEDE